MVSTTSCSKLPPFTVAMLALTVLASSSTSSTGAGTLTLPDEVPARMVMVALFDSVTVRSLPAGLVSEAV